MAIATALLFSASAAAIVAATTRGPAHTQRPQVSRRQHPRPTPTPSPTATPIDQSSSSEGSSPHTGPVPVIEHHEYHGPGNGVSIVSGTVDQGTKTNGGSASRVGVVPTATP
jgi:hypothetical protein